jgi:hypothetical protein
MTDKRLQAPEDKDLDEQLDEWEWRAGRRPSNTSEWFAEVKAIEDAWFRYAQQQWRIGQAPTSDAEWDREFRLREMERRWEAEQEDRKSRAEDAARAAEVTASGDNVRSYVLLFVIAGIVGTPVYAMVAEVDPQSFGQYIAPVTGIAGTVIGYWFGQRGGTGALAAPEKPPLPPEPTPAPKSTIGMPPASPSPAPAKPETG